MPPPAVASSAAGGRVSDVPIIQTAHRDRGPVRAAGPVDERQPREDLRLPAEERGEEAALREQDRAAPGDARRSAAPSPMPTWQPLMKFYESGRTEAGDFDAGVTELVTAVLSSPDFLYRAIPTSRWRRRVAPAHRSGAGLAPVVLPVEHRPGRGADRPGRRQRAVRPGGAWRPQVARMLKDPRANTLVENFALALAQPR